MADKGETLLTAERARRLAEEIRDAAPSKAVANIIPSIRAAAEQGEFVVYETVERWPVAATEMLKALGYTVSVRHTIGAIAVTVSW